MLQWLNDLSNPAFMPHGHCYLWRPDILGTHVISDLSIAMAYYAIPAVLAIVLYKRRQNIPYPEVLALFVAFIFLCGTTHLINIYVTWFPAYEIQGWVKALTAVVSVATALTLIPKLPALLNLPGLKQAYEESQQALQLLNEKNQQMETMYANVMERENRLLELKEEVNKLLEAQGETPKYLQTPGTAP